MNHVRHVLSIVDHALTSVEMVCVVFLKVAKSALGIVVHVHDNAETGYVSPQKTAPIAGLIVDHV